MSKNWKYFAAFLLGAICSLVRTNWPCAQMAPRRNAAKYFQFLDIRILTLDRRGQRNGARLSIWPPGTRPYRARPTSCRPGAYL